jgi:glucose-1-phosphate thymidylyltransferase
LQYVLDHNIIHGGEYQINDGIKRMMAAGKIFKTGTVDEWMDCGNKEVTVATNARMLGFLAESGAPLISEEITLENAKIIEPCFIAAEVILKNSSVGPYVSIGKGTIIENSTVKNSIIQTHSVIKNATLDNAMIGNHVIFDANFTDVSLGDYSELK